MLVVKATNEEEAKRWMNAIDHKIRHLEAEKERQSMLAVGLNLAQTAVREGVLKLGIAGLFGKDKWVDQYFFLSDGTLSWYNTNADQTEKKGEAQGSLLLQEDTKFQSDQNSDQNASLRGACIFSVIAEGETKKDDVVLHLMVAYISLCLVKAFFDFFVARCELMAKYVKCFNRYACVCSTGK
jgi:hypothetical protein